MSSSETVEGRRWLFRAIALLLGVTVSIIALEGLCRVFKPVYLGPPDYFSNFFIADAELGHKMAPNFKGLYQQDYELTYTTNSFGLRDREFAPDPPPGVVRILAVGDSWTFGLGVDLSETWPKQLERALAERGIKAEVINAGVSGYSTLTYSKVLRRFYDLYHPQLTVVMVCANDPGGDIAVAAGNFGFAIKPQAGVIKTFLKRRSALAMNLWITYLALRTPKDGYTFMNTLTLRPDSDPDLQRGYTLYQDALLAMREFAHNKGMPLLLTAVPMGERFLTHTRELSRAQQLDYISLESLKGDPSIDGSNSGGHYNPDGYRRIAAILADALAQRK
jgi:lysophospholipase L1-like esterase